MSLLSALLLLLFAPIPKQEYQGNIGIIVTAPDPAIIVIKPDGTVVKKIAMKDSMKLLSIKMMRNGRKALITNQVDPVKIGNAKVIGKSSFLLDFETEKTTEIFAEKAFPRLCPSNDNEHIFGTEIDDEIITADGTKTYSTKSWKLNLKSMKYETLNLPNDQHLVDIDESSDRITTLALLNQSKKLSVFSLKNADPKKELKAIYELKGTASHAISPNGQILFCSNNELNQIKTIKFENNTIQTIQPPEKNETFKAFTFSVNNKYIAFMTSADSENADDDELPIFRIYTCHIDGSEVKKIYESQPNEHIQDIDWR